MCKNQKIKQHYVSQFYLKYFSNKISKKEFRCYVFDKKNNTIKYENINNVAQEEKFYNCSDYALKNRPDFIKQLADGLLEEKNNPKMSKYEIEVLDFLLSKCKKTKINENFHENLFSEMEASFASSYESFIKNLDKYLNNKKPEELIVEPKRKQLTTTISNSKKFLSMFIAFQILRTKNVRENFITKTFKDLNVPLSDLHLAFLEIELPKLAHSISNLNWMVGYNFSNNPFVPIFTSDMPVFILSENNYYFPLTPKYFLWIMSEKPSIVNENDDSAEQIYIMPVNHKIINVKNDFLLMGACDYIYSNDINFKTMIKIMTKE